MTGSYPNPLIAAGVVTSSAFAPGAVAPDSTDLAGSPASDYGAVLSGRMNGLTTTPFSGDDGAPSGISTAGGATNETLSPSVDLMARDLSVQLTAAPGASASRTIVLGYDDTPALSCTISDSATTCTAPGPALIPAGSMMYISDVTGGTSPAASDLLFAFRMTEH